MISIERRNHVAFFARKAEDKIMVLNMRHFLLNFLNFRFSKWFCDRTMVTSEDKWIRFTKEFIHIHGG